MAKRSIFISEEELLEIKRLYVEENVNLTKISKQFPYSVHIISARLKEIGIEITNKQNLLNFDLDKDIIPLYKNGMSFTKIAEKFKTSRHTLANHLKAKGIEIVNQQNITKFDETVFDTIDTEEKAYWLGFIWADGYISSSDFSFELSLAIHDVNHLHKFMKHNKDNVKLGTTSNNGKQFSRCRWFVTNKHLWNVLNNYGCTPRKSLTLQFPDESIFSDYSLIKHFIRGYFDGCISYSATNKNKTTYNVIASILGTKECLSKIEEYLLEEGINGFFGTEGHAGKAKDLRFAPTSARKLINFLYNNSTIYLDRKYNRAMFFKETCRSAEELAELLEGEIGETPIKDNSEVISEITQGSETPLSVAVE